MNTALNRSTVLYLTNKSGGDVVQGDVVILDTANASAFTTSTVLGYNATMLGVVIEPRGILNNNSGMVVVDGYCPKITLNASASLGDKIGHYSVAKQGTPHSTIRLGDFAQAITTGTSPQAILFPMNKAPDYMLYEDQKTQNTSGGSSSAATWNNRDLNTEVSDSGGWGSVASNKVTLLPGTYRFRAVCPAYNVGRHQVRLYNVTDASVIKVGMSSYNTVSGDDQNSTEVVGVLTITASKDVRVDHYTQGAIATRGLGVESNATTEVYTQLELWKVA